MKEPIILRVEWVDCVLLHNTWADEDGLQAAKTPIVSVGFKVKSEDGFLYLAGSWQADDSHLHWAQAIAIPELAIVSTTRISKKRIGQ